MEKGGERGDRWRDGREDEEGGEREGTSEERAASQTTGGISGQFWGENTEAGV